MYQSSNNNLIRRFFSHRYLSIVQIDLKTAICCDWLAGTLGQYDIRISLVYRPVGQYHNYLVVFNLKGCIPKRNDATLYPVYSTAYGMTSYDTQLFWTMSDEWGDKY